MDSLEYYGYQRMYDILCKMPDKRLINTHYFNDEGEVDAIGALLKQLNLKVRNNYSYTIKRLIMDYPEIRSKLEIEQIPISVLASIQGTGDVYIGSTDKRYEVVMDSIIKTLRSFDR